MYSQPPKDITINSPLQFIVCGMEHTGTTLISDLFRQVPHLNSGFECGVLLRDTPQEFEELQPFAQNMLSGWGITQAQFSECCAASSFPEFYARLKNASTVLEDGTIHIFDKTPRYLSQLTSVLENSSCPVVVSYKDPRAMVCSDFKRAKVDDFDDWYDKYRITKMSYFKTCYAEFETHKNNKRVTTVGLEELSMNARVTMERMFSHVGENFKLSYAIIENLRYNNVKNNTVSASIAFEFRSKLSASDQQRVLDDFGGFKDWVYE